MKKTQDLSWAQMAMAANAPMLTKATMVDGHLEVGILPTGQGVGAHRRPAELRRADRPHRRRKRSRRLSRPGRCWSGKG